MARIFNGTSDYGSVALDLSFTNRVALAFWLWWDSFAADANDNALEYGTDWFLQNGFDVRPNSTSGQVGVSTGDNSLQDAKRFPRPTAAAWHHYMIRYDRSAPTSDQISVWVDGVSQSVTSAGTNQDITNNFGNRTLYIMSRAGSSLFGAGRMADLALWAGLLPHAQDATTLTSGLPPDSSRLSTRPYAYWPMRNGSGHPAIGTRAITWVGGSSTSDPPRIRPFAVLSLGVATIAALSGIGAAEVLVTVTHTAHGYTTGQKVMITGANEGPYNGIKTITVVDADTYTYTAPGNPSTPATGTIKSHRVILDGDADTNGVVQDTGFNYTADIAVSGIVRRASGGTYYKPAPLSGTVGTAGLDVTAFLSKD